MTAPLLAINDLTVAFHTEGGEREVLSRLTLAIGPGEIVGLVGESGSGKSVTALAIMRLLGPLGSVRRGGITLDGTDLLALSEAEMLRVRGRKAAMIFQEPTTSLNPLFTVGFQVAEVMRVHLGLSAHDARGRTVALFERVGIPSPALRYDDYPHQLSGGMRQRVVIAMAIACRPRLLIADEPTTALDVTIQAQILELMRELRREDGSAILLITHDMGVIARMADRVAVIYAGEVVETAPLADLLTTPMHPYTRLLLAAVPTTRRKAARLPMIAGAMPTAPQMPSGCRFHPRCPDVLPACSVTQPALDALTLSRAARCLRAREFMCRAGIDAPSSRAEALA